MVCPACRSSRMLRQRRSFTEKFRFAAVYVCQDCKQSHRVPIRRRYPMLSLNVCCPRCGTRDLRIFTRIDNIEGMYNNPFSRIQQLFGATLWYCQWCRLQFFDCRKLRR